MSLFKRLFSDSTRAGGILLKLSMKRIISRASKSIEAVLQTSYFIDFLQKVSDFL